MSDHFVTKSRLTELLTDRVEISNKKEKQSIDALIEIIIEQLT